MENLLIIHLVNNVEIVGFIHVGVKACSSIKKKIPIAVFWCLKTIKNSNKVVEEFLEYYQNVMCVFS